ncbi:MAG: hypothetical protein A2176_02415 [Spirochaetes bacterium RBG_13_51_14]|nr:MAG: hypothetical protein A2176_02415 [Spirochaetes bacterium RBG_13_51_14]
MNLKTIITIILVVLMTILAMQNIHSVAVKVFFWEMTFPLIILIVISLVIGFIAGYIATSIMKLVKTKGDDT